MREVAQLLNETGLCEVAFETTGSGPATKMTLRRQAFAPADAHQAASVPGEPEAEPKAGPAQQAYVPPVLTVTSSAVGVFRAPRPALQRGDIVRRRQVVAVVESLKIPTEIFASEPATVVEVFVTEGQGVEWGQPLLTLAPLEH